MERQKLLVIGATGFLGGYAVEAAGGARSFDLIEGDRSTRDRRTETGIAGVQIDIAEPSSVERAFDLARPDLVLLLAAISDIDRCESSPDTAFAVNARGAESVARACARSGARLLFASSAAVFDGSRSSYCEDDAPSPLSVYGKTKLWAERAVQELLPSAILLRFALALGFARRMATNAMLDALLAKWKAGQAVGLSTLERRNPIHAAALARIMVGMVATPGLSGVFHAGATDSLSRYELGVRLAIRAGVSTELVRPQDNPIPGRAPRGLNHFLLTEKLRKVMQTEPETTQQAIERCFA